MEEPKLLMPGGGTGTPGDYVRLALLFMLLGLTAGLLPFLLIYPPANHQVMVYLDEEPCGGPRAGYYRLHIGANGGFALDGRPQQDLHGLRRSLILLVAREPEPRLMLSAHPETRYETFLEILAQTKRAGIGHARLLCAEERDLVAAGRRAEAPSP